MEKILESKPIKKIFTQISPHYDLINRIMTFGLDQKWRKACAKACLANGSKRILDLGCGTGDLTFQITSNAPHNASIYGLDFNSEMLEKAKEKATSLPESKRPTFIVGDAASLPFPNNYFDSIGTAFTLRNLACQDMLTEKYLPECLRVLAPGGILVILETSQPNSKVIRWFYHLYLNSMVRGLGLLWGEPKAYAHLASSASKFYSPQELASLLQESGFKNVSYRQFCLGAIGLHIGRKP